MGYEVTWARAEVDPALDLIVARAGTRIAIRTPDCTEDADAPVVRRVHGSLADNRCSQCVVVTNGRFTASVRQVASDLGCRLIDAVEIPALIRGQLSL